MLFACAIASAKSTGGVGRAKKNSLDMLAASRFHRGQLFLGLDTFNNDIHDDVPALRGSRLDHRKVLDCTRQLGDERAIDL